MGLMWFLCRTHTLLPPLAKTETESVMVEIAKRLNAKVEKISSSAVTDFTKLMPILFIDAESIRGIEDSPEPQRFPKAR